MERDCKELTGPNIMMFFIDLEKHLCFYIFTVYFSDSIGDRVTDY